MPRLKIAVLFGGRSGEHEVSRNSAFTVATSLKKTYDVFPVGISKEGEWYGPIPISEMAGFSPDNFRDRCITILPNPKSNSTIYSLPDLEPITRIDVFFPVLHGTFGEDGTMQGLLELAHVPYVGAGVLASSVGMDKIIMKKVFEQSGLPQVPYLYYLRKSILTQQQSVMNEIEEKLGYPCFVKPVNMGSSVGISKASNSSELSDALLLAARYDRKVIVEKGVSAREIEVSVFGNDEPEASLPGEIVPCNEFYDYNAKYLDDRSALIIPAKLTAAQITQIRELAKKAYQAVDCSGLSRIDFFLVNDTNEILINEINTLPGFTSISMFPKLWEHSGIPLDELTAKLVQFAQERYEEKNRNSTTHEF